MESTRRQLIAGLAVSAIPTVAGCTSESETDDTQPADSNENIIEDITVSDGKLTVSLSKFEMEDHNLSSPTTVDYVAILTSNRREVERNDAVHGQLLFDFSVPDNDEYESDGEYIALAYGESQAGNGDTAWTAYEVPFTLDSGTVTIDG